MIVGLILYLLIGVLFAVVVLSSGYTFKENFGTVYGVLILVVVCADYMGAGYNIRVY